MSKLPYFRRIENKCVVWFPQSNQYAVMEIKDAELLKRLYTKSHIDEIYEWFDENYNCSEINKEDYINSIIELKEKYDLRIVNVFNTEFSETIHNNRTIRKYYICQAKSFCVDYPDIDILELIHPKFEYLEHKNSNSFDCHIEIIKHKKGVAIYGDKQFEGSWNFDQLHYLSGKFSMILLKKIHNKNDEDWLAVLHASAIANKEKSILFLGDSGSGKSTATAILSSRNYDLIADDFVPLDIDKQVNYFPAAVSIKEKAIPHLSDFYPELMDKERITKDEKSFVYLENRNAKKEPLTTKAVVFIEYKNGTETKYVEINSIESLTHIIPDTWVAPYQKNIELFLDWIEETPAYKFTYSNNSDLIKFVESIFVDE